MISPNIGHNGSEKKNLLHFLLLHPFYLSRFIVRSPLILLLYLIRRERRENILMKRKKNFRPTAERKNRLYFQRFQLLNRIEVKDIDDFEEIELSSRAISSRQEPDWSYIYEDIEDTFSLNRFGWLLTAIHARPSAKLSCRALEWITHWIENMGKRFQHPAWESYSVSERLANWPFILQICERFQPFDADTEKKIAANIGNHLDYLLQNLELRGDATNNHILNNARGLYIGGLAVKHESAIQKAKELFIEWTPKLFHGDGMLKESSSHYQFLICQRFEQVCLLSHLSGEGDFAAFMKKWTEAARRARDFFKIKNYQNTWTMPLIGDISPDYKPTWFSPFSRDGWKVIRESYAGGDSFSPYSQAMHNGLSRMSEGFFRYDQGDATVFWHVPDGPVPAGSHGHFDTGSFVLFLKGKDIFTDPGRFSYRTEGSTGVYSRAHNCLLIDGLGPFCEDRRLNLIDACPHQTSHTMVTANKDGGPTLSLVVDGFRRLASPVRWERSFFFKERTMIIHDEIKSRGNHRLETRFIFAEGLSAEKTDGGVYIKSKSEQIVMKLLNPAGNPTFFIEKAEISRMYGRAKETLAFVVKNTTRGNHTNIYEIQWQA